MKIVSSTEIERQKEIAILVIVIFILSREYLINLKNVGKILPRGRVRR